MWYLPIYSFQGLVDICQYFYNSIRLSVKRKYFRFLFFFFKPKSFMFCSGLLRYFHLKNGSCWVSVSPTKNSTHDLTSLCNKDIARKAKCLIHSLPLFLVD